MRMITGAILILAATVLFSAQWLGKVMHSSVITGSPESGYITFFSFVLGFIGLGVLVFGLITDRSQKL